MPASSTMAIMRFADAYDRVLVQGTSRITVNPRQTATDDGLRNLTENSKLLKTDFGSACRKKRQKVEGRIECERAIPHSAFCLLPSASYSNSPQRNEFRWGLFYENGSAFHR